MTLSSCFGCRYFVITYIPATPYACRAFQFKSRRLPALEVMASSGQPCKRREPTQQNIGA